MAKPSAKGDKLEAALKAAYHAADEYSEDSESCDSETEKGDRNHLAGLLYACYCYFSEEGTTSAQDERLKAYGFPGKQ